VDIVDLPAEYRAACRGELLRLGHPQHVPFASNARAYWSLLIRRKPSVSP
jgi:hypothetical protein